MIYTIEDTLEVLAGARIVNDVIRLHHRDKHIINSIARQVGEKIGLTDRQLELVKSKFLKYKLELERNGIDVDVVTEMSKTRMPLREIDRTQRIYVDTDNDSMLVIKHNNTQHFSDIWKMLSPNLTSPGLFHSAYKRVEINEQNVYEVVSALQPEGFVIEDQLLELYNKIYEILESPIDHAPHMTIENGQYTFKNLTETCSKFINEQYPEINDSNLLNCLHTAKQCGIYLKSLEVTDKINEIAISNITKKVLMHESSKFKADPTTTRLRDIFAAVNEMNQWPVIAIIDEETALESVTHLLDSVNDIVDNSKINVFFRLDKEYEDANKFNQMVKDLGLNNYIDANTKIVVVSKKKLPKPLLTSNWEPTTALYLSMNSYGKIGTYTKRCSNVYYYNNSITVATAARKGAYPVVFL